MFSDVCIISNCACLSHRYPNSTGVPELYCFEDYIEEMQPATPEPVMSLQTHDVAR